jgi:histidinol-phosphate aminotransferase
MDYSGWGDGLRISVGTDEQIDVCLSALESIMERKAEGGRQKAE